MPEGPYTSDTIYPRASRFARLLHSASRGFPDTFVSAAGRSPPHKCLPGVRDRPYAGEAARCKIMVTNSLPSCYRTTVEPRTTPRAGCTRPARGVGSAPAMHLRYPRMQNRVCARTGRPAGRGGGEAPTFRWMTEHHAPRRIKISEPPPPSLTLRFRRIGPLAFSPSPFRSISLPLPAALALNQPPTSPRVI